MAQNDAATLSITTAKFFTAPVGTELDGASWTEMGHTSLEEVLVMETEGGEVTTLGTLQKKQLRTKRTPIIDSFRLDLQQFDSDALKLFHGSNATVGADGLVEVPADPIPTSAAWKMVANDGLSEFVIYAEKAEIFRAEGASFSNDEALSSLPLSIRPLQNGDSKGAYKMGLKTPGA